MIQTSSTVATSSKLDFIHLDVCLQANLRVKTDFCNFASGFMNFQNRDFNRSRWRLRHFAWASGRSAGGSPRRRSQQERSILIKDVFQLAHRLIYRTQTSEVCI